jgi:CHAT domain-containing protein
MRNRHWTLRWYAVLALGAVLAWPAVPAMAQDAAGSAAEAASLNRKGIAQFRENRYAEAADLFEQALRQYTASLGEKHRDTIQSLWNLVDALLYQRPEAALPHAQKLVQLRTDTLGGKHTDTLAALQKLSFVYYKLSRYEEAMAIDQQLLALRTETQGEKHPDTIHALRAVAIGYNNLGQPEKELPLLDKAWRLSVEARGERHLDSQRLLNDIGNWYRFRGRYAEALATFEKKLRIDTGAYGLDHIETIQSMLIVGIAYGDLGRHAEALPIMESYYRKSLEKYGARSRDAVHNMVRLGSLYVAAGRAAEGMPLLEQAVTLRGELFADSDRETIYIYSVLAGAHEAQGQVDKAIPLREKALALNRADAGARSFTTLGSQNELAQAYAAQGRLPEALALHAATLAARVETQGENHPDTIQSLRNTARTLQRMGRDAEAMPLYARLVAAVEALRVNGDLSPENRQALFAQWVDGYKSYALLLASAGRGDEAFRIAELSKARTLLESTALRRANEAGVLPADAAEQVRRFEQRLAALNNNIANAGDQAARKLALEADKNRAITEFATLRRTLAQRFPKYGQLGEVHLLGAADAARVLQPGTVLLSYLIDGDAVLAFALVPQMAGATPQLMALRLPDAAGLAGTIEAYRKLIAEPQGALGLGARGERIWRLGSGAYVTAPQAPEPGAVRVTEIAEIGRALGDRLLKPLAAQLAGARQIVVSPDGALALLPFETLPLGGKTLIEVADVSYTQSLSMLGLLQERDYKALAGRKTLFAMGGAEYQSATPAVPPLTPRAARAPGVRRGTDLARLTGRGGERAMEVAFDLLDVDWANLPGSEQEVAQVAALFAPGEVDVHTRRGATEAALQALNRSRSLAGYRYLLFSAHGYLSTEEPALSSLVLGQVDKAPGTDGYVTAGEWPGYDLQSELIVLSACDTGVGRVVQGEGVMGLPYALYVAGNRNTLLSLWPVVDESTTQFMVAFFRRLKQGLPQVKALADTKREFARDARYGAPLFWAPFVLYGD